MLMKARSTGSTAARRVIMLAAMGVFATPALAGITFGGDPGQVFPATPAQWNTGVQTHVGVNSLGTGTLLLDGGSTLEAWYTSIGYNPGSSGVATVSASGSALTVTGGLHVGSMGTGTLWVNNGGAATSK